MNFEDLPQLLQEEIKEIVLSDVYGLRAETLYNNIRFSTGSDEKLAEIFEVSVSLVMQIKKYNKEDGLNGKKRLLDCCC